MSVCVCVCSRASWGWMNSNETVRNTTTAHAQALSAVYPQIIATQTYASFTMHMLTVNWDQIFADWIAAGNDPAELIEQFDGVCALVCLRVFSSVTARHSHRVGRTFHHFASNSCPSSAAICAYLILPDNLLLFDLRPAPPVLHVASGSKDRVIKGTLLHGAQLVN